MGTITARKRNDGTIGYMAHVRVMQDSVTYHETKAFDKRLASAVWMKRRERDLAKPRGHLPKRLIGHY